MQRYCLTVTSFKFKCAQLCPSVRSGIDMGPQLECL